MLTENRKRRRGSDSEEGQQLNPHAKRSGGGPADLLVSDLGRDVWDSEQSSSSDSSGGISSPESGALAGAGPCARGQNGCISQSSLSPRPEDSASASLQGFHGNGSSSISSGSIGGGSSSSGGGGVSYHHINRVLREAHFSSLQIRAPPGST